MYKMREKNFLLQTLLLPLVLLSGHEYGETRQLALTLDAPASRLLGEAIPGNSTDTTWNLIGPPDTRLNLNCTDLSLLKSADCPLSIFENGEEEKICSKGESTVYSRQSEGNRLTVRIKTEPSTSGGRVSCDISLMKGSPLTDSEDYVDLNVQNDSKTSNPNEGTERKRIIGGFLTRKNDFPFMVVIQNSLQLREVHCGGTIINHRHILTAAHCVYGYVKEALRVTVGVHDVRTDLVPERTQFIQAIHPHEGYVRRTVTHDIALLFLTEDIQFGDRVKKVSLPTLRYELLYQEAIALGWGETSAGGNQSPVLKSVNLWILQSDLCSHLSPRTAFLDNPNPICFAEQDKNTCKRDSGGPLVIWNPNTRRFVQMGLITERRDCLFKIHGQPSNCRINTAIFPYVPWIMDIVNQDFSTR